MTSGQRLDTNSQWLSQQLESLGIRVVYHTTVADEFAANQAVFRRAVERADYVIATGGLGPTLDDLTRDVIAQSFDAPLEFHPDVFEKIEAMFQRRGRIMPARNRVQAEFPRGTRVIPNPHGTAPGIEFTVPRANQRPAVIFALPGVPAEMREMWFQTVQPRLMEHEPSRQIILGAIVKCFGLGESELESYIPELIEREHRPRVGITVNRATISLRIRAQADTVEEAQEQIDTTKSTIYQRLSPWIFGEGEDYELQHALRDVLRAQNLTLAVAEFGSHCLVGPWFSELDCPDVYRGGYHSPSMPLLGTSETYLASQPDPFGANLLLRINAYPPLENILRGEMASVSLSLISKGRKQAEHEFELGGHPDIIHARIAKYALNWVRKELIAT